MQARQLGKRRWILVLDRGEELVGAVTDFLEEHGIRGGWLTGLGAVKNLVLGYFDLEQKEYLKRTFEEVMELGSLVGSIGGVDGKPFLHAHATVCGPELIAFTGHLFRAEVAVTAELMLLDVQAELERGPDEETGLKLFNLERRPAGGAKKEND